MENIIRSLHVCVCLRACGCRTLVFVCVCLQYKLKELHTCSSETTCTFVIFWKSWLRAHLLGAKWDTHYSSLVFDSLLSGSECPAPFPLFLYLPHLLPPVLLTSHALFKRLHLCFHWAAYNKARLLRMLSCNCCTHVHRCWSILLRQHRLK